MQKRLLFIHMYIFIYIGFRDITLHIYCVHVWGLGFFIVFNSRLTEKQLSDSKRHLVDITAPAMSCSVTC